VFHINTTALVRIKASKGEKEMKDDFLEYGNNQPRPTFKGLLKQLCVWGILAAIFVVGMILNGSVKL